MADKAPAPALSADERNAVKERTAPRAIVVHEAIREEGETEPRRPLASLVWSGLAAGLSMGFSLAAISLLHSHLPETQWRDLIAYLGYSVGFLIVVLGRQQLFTENTLTVVLPLLERPNVPTLLRVLRLWAVVLVTNLIGALVFVWVIVHGQVFPGDIQRVIHQVGLGATGRDLSTLFVQGIFSGWLIAMMVWLLPGAQTARVQVIVIMTYLVALGGFPHIIVGSAEMFYLITAGALAWSDYFSSYFGPVLLGNIVGGVALVAILNYAQVVAESGNGD